MKSKPPTTIARVGSRVLIDVDNGNEHTGDVCQMFADTCVVRLDEPRDTSEGDAANVACVHWDNVRLIEVEPAPNELAGDTPNVVSIPDGYTDVLIVAEPMPEVSDLAAAREKVLVLIRSAQATAVALRGLDDIANDSSDEESREERNSLRKVYDKIWIDIAEEVLLHYLTLGLVEGGGHGRQ